MDATPARLLWPSALLLPAPIQVVALDTFVWRELSNAAAGRPSHPEFADLLQECRRAVDRRAAIFPVSLEFLTEANKYGGRAGREAVARTVAEIGRLQSLATRRVIRHLELDAALTCMLGPPAVELGPYLLVGQTLLHAFDQEMVMLRWDSQTGSLLNDNLDAMSAATMQEAARLGGLLELQRALLCSGDVGGEFTAPSRTTLAREIHIKHQLDRTGKRAASRYFHNLFLADELAHEMDGTAVDQAFKSRGMSFIEWLARDDRRLTTEIIERMPSCAVSLGLRKSYHRDSRMKLEQNDVNDIGFLSVAAPYCDAVYTDGPVRKTLQACGIGQIIHTKLLTGPRDAAEYIASLPAVRGGGTWRSPDPDAELTEFDPESSPGVYYFADEYSSD